METKWLNKTLAAKYAGISRKLLDEWIICGLPFRKIGGRYFLLREDIDNYIQVNGESDTLIDDLIKGL